MPFSFDALGDQRRHAHLVLDPREDRALGVGLLLVAEIHSRVEADIDAARDDPESHVRRHQAAVAIRNAPGLDRLEPVFAGDAIDRQAPPAAKGWIRPAALFLR